MSIYRDPHNECMQFDANDYSVAYIHGGNEMFRFFLINDLYGCRFCGKVITGDSGTV